MRRAWLALALVAGLGLAGCADHQAADAAARGEAALIERVYAHVEAHGGVWDPQLGAMDLLGRVRAGDCYLEVWPTPREILESYAREHGGGWDPEREVQIMVYAPVRDASRCLRAAREALGGLD